MYICVYCRGRELHAFRKCFRGCFRGAYVASANLRAKASQGGQTKSTSASFRGSHFLFCKVLDVEIIAPKRQNVGKLQQELHR